MEGLKEELEKTKTQCAALNKELNKKRKREEELIRNLEQVELDNKVQIEKLNRLYKKEWPDRSYPDFYRFVCWYEELTGHKMESDLSRNLEKLFSMPEGTSMVNMLVQIMWTVKTKNIKKEDSV